MMVAPNSPSDRAKPKSAAAITLRPASGRLIVQKIRIGPAPSVAAICSKRGFNCSKPARAVSAMIGRLITAIAMTTAFHVKTTSMPTTSSARPTGLRRPKSHNSSRPVPTGGITSGSAVTVSTSVRPGNRWRASTHPRKTPGGKRECRRRERHQRAEAGDPCSVKRHG